MGDLLDFNKAYQERKAREPVSTLSVMYRKARDLADSYHKLMSENPEQAIDRLPEFIKKVRNINPDRAIEALAGGPNTDWTAPILNILGTVYPELDRDVREKGLIQCLSFFENLNIDYSKDHVQLINEPWLASDIIINCPYFECGNKQYIDFSKKHKSWEDFSENISGTMSPFWLAMAVINPQYSSLDVRKNFYEKSPITIDRTKDALAAIATVYGGMKAERNNLPLDDCINERLSKYDPILHDDIRKKIEERKWVQL